MNNSDYSIRPAVPGWFSFSGRYTRAQFWWRWLVAATLVVVVSHFIGIALGMDLLKAAKTGRNVDGIINQFYLVTFGELVYALVVLLPLMVKRYHDTGRSTASAIVIWCILQGVGIVEVLISLNSMESMIHASSMRAMASAGDSMQAVSLICSVVRVVLGIMLLVIFCQDSQKGTNQYGPSYKYPDAL